MRIKFTFVIDETFGESIRRNMNGVLWYEKKSCYMFKNRSLVLLRGSWCEGGDL